MLNKHNSWHKSFDYAFFIAVFVGHEFSLHIFIDFKVQITVELIFILDPVLIVLDLLVSIKGKDCVLEDGRLSISLVKYHLDQWIIVIVDVILKS